MVQAPSPLPAWDLNCLVGTMRRKGQMRSVINSKVRWLEIPGGMFPT